MTRTFTLLAIGALTAGLLAVLGTASVAVPADAASSIRVARATTIFRGGLYVQPDSVAALAVDGLSGREKRAARYIARRSVAIWLGEWATGASLKAYLRRNLADADEQQRTAVFVAYALPNRDCGGHSAGGLSPAGYASWTRTIAKTLAGRRAVVLVEPDSLSQLNVCPPGTAEQRLPLLKRAVALYAKAKVPAYLDGGISGHEALDAAAANLRVAGVASARGFFTNVANYRPTADERGWAEALSRATGNSHYVVDVSRNGRGYSGEWCNAPGAGLGADPRVVRSTPRLDALLWVKPPGASDGECNGGPAAGQWFPAYAAALVANRAR
ncbi:glycoside hydrolase family 6 protein [Galbitalea sp. SE-J8]|uniref:glycoside hydrolase family 6 protein n=1 Tax=Galbitalea sp. SE-J8 TaxID=3054952 RepID=UPI00259C8796|nr:glycoside hydrolase family 6 protein [Galbitalea sp. SE-J8]MDM4762656.1 glycoside hydrolase family 6 protein [Galbitalea sp. SE-J8]